MRKQFHYHNTEKRIHKKRSITRKVVVSGGQGFKMVSMSKQGKTKRVRKALSSDEIKSIKNRKFIKGLFHGMQEKL
jgi:hypothetical protein